MSAIKAIFLDFDETLVGTYKANDVAYEAVKEELNSDEVQLSFSCDENRSCLLVDEIVKYFSRNLRCIRSARYKVENDEKIRADLWNVSILQNLSNANLIESCDSKARDLAQKLYSIWEKTRLENLSWLEDDTINVLEKLKMKYKLVLITNGSSNIQWRKINLMQVKKYFDLVIVSGDEPEDKPHASIFLKACNHLNQIPKNCVMVGDSVKKDIRGANAAGLGASVLMKKDSEKILEFKSELDIPTFTISELSELFTVCDL